MISKRIRKIQIVQVQAIRGNIVIPLRRARAIRNGLHLLRPKGLRRQRVQEMDLFHIKILSMSIAHYNDMDESSDSNSPSNSSSPRYEDESRKMATKSIKLFKSWIKNRRHAANWNQTMNECVMTTQWLQYVGDFDANHKPIDNWGEQMQDLSPIDSN